MRLIQVRSVVRGTRDACHVKMKEAAVELTRERKKKKMVGGIRIVANVRIMLWNSRKAPKINVCNSASAPLIFATSAAVLHPNLLTPVKNRGSLQNRSEVHPPNL